MEKSVRPRISTFQRLGSGMGVPSGSICSRRVTRAKPLGTAERRESVAPGASPGFCAVKRVSPRAKDSRDSFAPPGLEVQNDTLPPGLAPRGYTLTPLRGCDRSDVFRRRFSPSTLVIAIVLIVSESDTIVPVRKAVMSIVDTMVYTREKTEPFMPATAIVRFPHEAREHGHLQTPTPECGRKTRAARARG